MVVVKEKSKIHHVVINNISKKKKKVPNLVLHEVSQWITSAFRIHPFGDREHVYKISIILMGFEKFCAGPSG